MARTGLRGPILSVWVEGGARWHPRALDNFARPSASLGNVTWPIFWVKPAGEGYASRGECNSLLRRAGTQVPTRRLWRTVSASGLVSHRTCSRTEAIPGSACARSISHLSDRIAEVSPNWRNFRFPGRGRRDTPVTDVRRPTEISTRESVWQYGLSRAMHGCPPVAAQAPSS